MKLIVATSIIIGGAFMWSAQAFSTAISLVSFINLHNIVKENSSRYNTSRVNINASCFLPPFFSCGLAVVENPVPHNLHLNWGMSSSCYIDPMNSIFKHWVISNLEESLINWISDNWNPMSFADFSRLRFTILLEIFKVFFVNCWSDKNRHVISIFVNSIILDMDVAFANWVGNLDATRSMRCPPSIPEHSVIFETYVVTLLTLKAMRITVVEVGQSDQNTCRFFDVQAYAVQVGDFHTYTLG